MSEGRVLKCGKEIRVNRYYPRPAPSSQKGGVMREGGDEGEREGEGEAGRGRISCEEGL